MIEASREFVAVLAKKNDDLEARYGGIDGYPTVLFAGADEKVILTLDDREPEAVVRQMRQALAAAKR